MDFTKLIKELALVMSIDDIAKEINRSPRQVRNYRQGQSEPGYEAGAKLISMHTAKRRRIKRLLEDK